MLLGMGPVAVIAAHPDDETIGVGAQLARFPDVHLIHVTDGAPRNGRDASAFGFDSPQSYARARRAELRAAMALASIGPERLGWAGFVDQEASLDLAALARRLAEMLGALRPKIVLTHAYEGGHQDHDATAFGVHAACALLGSAAPEVREFTSYHAGNGGMEVGKFLAPGNTEQCRVVRLSEPERALKRRMMESFQSQQHMLRLFPVDVERLRKSPRYDFTAAPHPGPLYYEQFDWNMDGRRWRMLAGQALESLL
jgi:N-acetylglucosamine malate deacetylase 2